MLENSQRSALASLEAFYVNLQTRTWFIIGSPTMRFALREAQAENKNDVTTSDARLAPWLQRKALQGPQRRICEMLPTVVESRSRQAQRASSTRTAPIKMMLTMGYCTNHCCWPPLGLRTLHKTHVSRGHFTSERGRLVTGSRC